MKILYLAGLAALMLISLWVIELAPELAKGHEITTVPKGVATYGIVVRADGCTVNPCLPLD